MTENEEGESITRKRRLSRKEQKERKKQKRKTHQNNVAPKRAPTQDHRSTEKIILDGGGDDDDDEFLKNYEPIPLPPQGKDVSSPATQSLGKWFPKAKVIKSITSASDDAHRTVRASILLFYQYSIWPKAKVHQLLTYLSQIAEKRHLGGRIRVAQEGVNATVSSVDCDGQSAACTLRHFCQDLKNFDNIFMETDFKFMDNLAADRHFKDLKLLPVKELVYYGFDEKALADGGKHVEAEAFHKLLEQDSTVVIDVRNHYESAIVRNLCYRSLQRRKLTNLMRRSLVCPRECIGTFRWTVSAVLIVGSYLY